MVIAMTTPRAIRAGVTCCVVALALVSAVAIPEAHADDKALADIEKVAKAAMDNYDNFDVEQAKKQLEGAIGLAQKKGVESDPRMAKIHVYLAIVHLGGESDADRARAALAEAVKIDPDVTIPVLYRNDDLQTMLDEVKAELGGSESGSDAVDCSAVEGLEHTLIDTTTAGTDLELTALLGADIEAAKVSLFYRLHGVPGASPDFNELEMSASDSCVYKATIPGTEIASGVIHYYIAALDADGRELASKGGERTPNIVEIEGADGGGSDPDDPFGTTKKGPKGPKGPSKLFISAALGTGAGLVTGETEQMGAPVNTGFAPALLHVFPEVGYYLNPRSSISAAFRLGFPIGANIQNHATAAVAGVVRYRQSLAEDGTGVFWSAALGGGMIRQTIKLADVADETMNVDITTIGPLFVGGGAGYAHALSDSMRFVAEVDALIGLPVIKSIGSTPRLNFGVQFDVNIGMAVAF